MDKDYNNKNQYMTRFGAKRFTNGRSAWLNREEYWYIDDYSKDTYSWYS